MLVTNKKTFRVDPPPHYLTVKNPNITVNNCPFPFLTITKQYNLQKKILPWPFFTY